MLLVLLVLLGRGADLLSAAALRNSRQSLQRNPKPRFSRSLWVAALFRRHCTRASSISPTSSTARHRCILLPAMRAAIPSKRERGLGFGRRRRAAGSNASTQRRIVS